VNESANDISWVRNGDEVKDTLTDLEGTVIATILYLSGCVQHEVLRKKPGSDGKMSAEWVDWQRLNLKKKPTKKRKATTKEPVKRRRGGPAHTNPPVMSRP